MPCLVFLRRCVVVPLLALGVAAITACASRDTALQQPAAVAVGGGRVQADAAAVKPRALSPEFFSRKAVAYSGYRGADHQSPPSEAQVLQDLQLLTQGGYGLIRLFGSDDADTGVVLRTIRAHRLDLKVQLGIWIAGSPAKAGAANQAEIARGIALARAYPDIVLAVSVGNETMVDWSMHLPPADIAAYVRQVRAAVAQPVTTDDNWAPFANLGGKYAGIDEVLRTVDFVSMHTYPLLDSVYDPLFHGWQQPERPPAERAAAMMDFFFRKAQADYDAVRVYLDEHGFARLPVTIGETGWKAVGPQADRIHPANQKMYAERLAAWKGGPRQIFWFEAFDEPWKGDDDGWGLFDVHRRARSVVQALVPPTEQDGTHTTERDAVYWRSP
jgi:exo-beta-1,3-glucanase (GH17 family)